MERGGDLRQDLRRWMAADREGREDEADAAFRAIAATLPRPMPSAGFSERVIRTAERMVPPAGTGRSRWAAGAAAAAVTVGGTGLAYLAVTVVLPLLARELVRLFGLTVQSAVWVLLALEEGLDAWAIMAQAGRALGAAIATPQVSATLLVIELAGLLALYGLHRLLASESQKESA